MAALYCLPPCIVSLTSTLTLGAGQRIWCAAEDTAFRYSFGHAPVCAWDVASESGTAELDGSLSLTNYGGHIQLRDAQGRLIDALLYGDVDHAIEGWTGFAGAGLHTGRHRLGRPSLAAQARSRPLRLPLDSDAASDWAGDLADVAWGRRVSYPGWPTDAFARPAHSVEYGDSHRRRRAGGTVRARQVRCWRRPNTPLT